MSDERFVHAWLLQLDPAWRRRSAEERHADIDAFCAAAGRAEGRLMQHAYSTIGLRAEGDLLLWRMAESIEAVEATAAEIDSQMANLRATNPDILLLYTLPLITADAVRYMQANDWHPQVVWGYINPNTLLGALLGGAGGPEAGYQQIAGNISTNYILDTVGDADNPAMVEHVRIMGQYGGPDPVSQLSVYGQSLAELMVETLDGACQNGDMTRAGVLEAAESIQGYTSDLYLPGIEVNLSDTDHFAIQDLQPVRFRADGTLETLGELVNAEDVVAEGDSTPE